MHQQPGSPTGPGPGPGRALPPRPRSGLIRTTLQGSERFAREGEAPAPAAGRRAARGRLGYGGGDRQGAGPLAWRPPPPVEESNPVAERGEGGDIRGLSRARRKGEGGGDPRPVRAERIQTKTKRLKEQRLRLQRGRAGILGWRARVPRGLRGRRAGAGAGARR